VIDVVHLGTEGMCEVRGRVQSGGADSLKCLVVLEESYKCVNIKLVKKVERKKERKKESILSHIQI
jgi:hypothetical protein